MGRYIKRNISAQDVDDLAAQVEDEFERVALNLTQPTVQGLIFESIVIEPRRADALMVMVADTVNWSGQNLQRGLYIFNGVQDRWDKA